MKYEWLKELIPSESSHEEFSLALGTPDQFSWEGLAEALGGHFGLSLALDPGEMEWISSESYKKLNAAPFALDFTVGSVPGAVRWMIGRGDLSVLMGRVISQGGSPPVIDDLEILKGFAHFVAYEIAAELDQFGIGESETGALRLIGNSHAFDGPKLLHFPITFSLNERTFVSHLLLDEAFAADWQEKYPAHPRSDGLSEEFAESLRLRLQVVIGSCHPTVEEWKRASVGDLLLLDACTISFKNPEVRKALIMARGVRLFSATIEEGGVTLGAPTEVQLKECMMPPTPPSENAENKENEEVGLGQLPLEVVVEVGRLEMSLAQLMALNPGQLLELGISTDAEISLTVNGSCIGRGELVRVGQMLGVRLTHLHK